MLCFLSEWLLYKNWKRLHDSHLWSRRPSKCPGNGTFTIMQTSGADNLSSLSKSILSGLLAGLMVAFLGLICTIAYRETTGFATAKIIMPISIFIGFPVLLVLGGLSYYFFKKQLKKVCLPAYMNKDQERNSNSLRSWIKRVRLLCSLHWCQQCIKPFRCTRKAMMTVYLRHQIIMHTSRGVFH